MAIPDALGGNDKTLSDVDDSVRQTIKLPDALLTEAHAETLPLAAPKSDVLPQVTLTQPTNLVTQQVASPVPIKVAEANTAISPITAPTTVARLDSDAARVITPKPVEVATVSPVAAVTQQIANPVPMKVAEANTVISPTTVARLDSDAARVITPKPAEVATTSPAAAVIQQVASPVPIKVAEANTTISPITAPITVARLDSSTQQITTPKLTEVATTSPAAAVIQQVASPVPIKVAEANTTISPITAPITVARLDSSTQQITTPKLTEVATTSPAAAVIQQVASPVPIKVAEANTTISPITAPITVARLDSDTTRVITPKPAEVATAGPTTTAVPTHLDIPTPAKVLDKLASAMVLPQLPYVGPASPKSKTSEKTIVTPAPRIHNPQLAMAREAMQNLATSTTSYTVASLPQESKATVPPAEKESHTAALPPKSISGIPGTKDVTSTVRVNDPQSLPTAMETAASRKAGIPNSIGPAEVTTPTGKPVPPALQGTQITNVPGIKQDALTSPQIMTDVHGRILPPVNDTRTVQTAGGSSMPPLDGRLIQNPNQLITPDTKQGVPDPRKGLEIPPGTIGPGTPTGQVHDDTKRILDVPNLNLDDKTQLTGEKGKTHVTSQSSTGDASRTEQSTQAEAELADLLNKAQKGKKEQPEEGDKVDAAGAATQEWVVSKRLEHRVREGETLDLISRKYFGDDIVATLIVEINHSMLNPRVHKHNVVVALIVDSIIQIPSPAEVTEFKKQLTAGRKTRMNIIYE